MKNTYMRSNGDFTTKENDKGWVHIPSSPANRYIHSNGWTIMGVEKTGAYGLAHNGIEFILRFQDPDTGGFYSRYDLATDIVGKRILFPTSSAGLALLACGRLTEALRAGDSVLKVLATQPERDKLCFTSWHKGHGVMTDVFKEEETTALRSRKNFRIDARKDPLYEMVWFVGMAMRFSCSLYELSGERKYLDGAMQLHDFYTAMGEQGWINYFRAANRKEVVGKLMGWIRRRLMMKQMRE